MHIPRGPGRLIALAVLGTAVIAGLGALALATAPDVPPPPGLLYRSAFISRDGAVQDSTLEASPGIDTRPVFVGRDGSIQQTTLAPPPDVDVRSAFIDRDGGVQQQTLPPPPGLLNPGAFIGRDGHVVPGFENLTPPPGLDTRPVFIGRDGEVVDSGTAAPPRTPSPAYLELRGVYPNPFNPMVEISFHLTVAAQARVTVVDARGRLVRVLHDGPLAADLHVLRWDGRDDAGRSVSAGSYLFRVQAAGREVSARGALVK